MGQVRNEADFQEKINQGIDDKYGSRLEMLKVGAFKALGRASWEGSSIERRMGHYLDKQGKEYERQHWVGRRRVDFYIPAEKLFIECDSKSYHNDEVKERKRDLEILYQKPDHQIAHVFYGEGPPRWDFFDLARLNHTQTFTQIDLPVLSVEQWHLKRPRKLFNFAVEDDESYIAKGVVAHNCRCTTVPVMIGELTT
jgi:hypothetical protein